MQKENDLQYLTNLKERRGDQTGVATMVSMMMLPSIKLSRSSKKARRKTANDCVEATEELSFLLVDTPDDQACSSTMRM